IYMALLSTVAFRVWTILMKYNPVGKVVVYTFTIPIFGAVLSGIILGENMFELKNLIALVLVSAGIIIVNKPEAQNLNSACNRAGLYYFIGNCIPYEIKALRAGCAHRNSDI